MVNDTFIHTLPSHAIPVTLSVTLYVTEVYCTVLIVVAFLSQDSRDSSLGSNNSSGSGQSGGSIPGPHHQRQRSPEVVNLLAMLEAVMAALEEPKGMCVGGVVCIKSLVVVVCSRTVW